MVGCVTLCHNNPSVVLPGTNIYVPLHQILSFRLRDPLRDPAYLARGQEARHSSVVSKRQMDRGNSDCCFVQARKHNHRSVSRFRSGIALLLHTNVGPCSQITFGILCFVWGDLCCTCTYFWSPCWASDPLLQRFPLITLSLREVERGAEVLHAGSRCTITTRFLMTSLDFWTWHCENSS